MRTIHMILAVVALALGFAPLANAGMLLEPYLGYGSTPVNYDLKASPGDSRDLGTGTVMGGRVAYTAPLVFVGADYSMQSLAMKNTVAASGTTSADYNATASTLYGIVGVNVPMLQAYAGYGLMDQFTSKPSTGDTTFSGNAYKVGLGYTGLPVMSLNLEYQMHSFSKVKDSSGEQDVSVLYNKLNSNALMLSVSAPFHF